MEELEEPFKDPLYRIDDERVELPATFKIVCCPNCETTVPSSDLNISEKVGKCGSCQAIFSIEKDIQKLHSSPQKIKQEILRPEGIELFYFGDELEITFEQPIGWLEWVLLFLLVIPFIAGIGMSIELGTILPFILLTLLPVALIALYAYRKKAKHRVVISIDELDLNIMNKPRKLKVDQHYSIKHIQQLYVKHRPDIGVWRLCMIVDEGNGQKHVNLSSLKSASKAKYLEQEIEAHLNIQDVVVPEES